MVYFGCIRHFSILLFGLFVQSYYYYYDNYCITMKGSKLLPMTIAAHDNLNYNNNTPGIIKSALSTEYACNRVLRLSIVLLARGQLNRENEHFPLSPFAPDILVSRDRFGRPVPRQPNNSINSASCCCLKKNLNASRPYEHRCC